MGCAASNSPPPVSPQELAQKQAEEEALRGPAVVSPHSDYKDKYSHLIGKVAAKDAAHTMEANKAYGCGEWGGGREGGLLAGWARGSSPAGSAPTPPPVLLPVPAANKRDTRSIEEAMDEIRAKKRLRQAEEGSRAPPAKSP